MPHTISGESFQTKNPRCSRRRESVFLSACGLCFNFEVRCEFFLFRRGNHLQLDAAVAAPRAESGGKLSSRAAGVVLTVGQSADEQQEAERREATPVPATFTQLSLAALPSTRPDQRAQRTTTNPFSFHSLRQVWLVLGRCVRELSAAPHRSPPWPDPTTKLCTPSAASSTSRDWASRPGTSSE